MRLQNANSWYKENALLASPKPIAFATGKTYGAERGSIGAAQLSAVPRPNPE